MNNATTTRTLAAAIILMLTAAAATITPLAAFAYNGGTNGKTITEQDQSIARVKPQVDLNVPASASVWKGAEVLSAQIETAPGRIRDLNSILIVA